MTSPSSGLNLVSMKEVTFSTISATSTSVSIAELFSSISSIVAANAPRMRSISMSTIFRYLSSVLSARTSRTDSATIFFIASNNSFYEHFGDTLTPSMPLTFAGFQLAACFPFTSEPFTLVAIVVFYHMSIELRTTFNAWSYAANCRVFE